METVCKPKEKKTKKKKAVKELNNSLEGLFGLLKGKIFCDDAIFNLGVKQ